MYISAHLQPFILKSYPLFLASGISLILLSGSVDMIQGIEGAGRGDYKLRYEYFE